MPSTCKSLPRRGDRPAVTTIALGAAAAATLLLACAQGPLATLLIIAPAAEEAVFRGGMQEALLRRGGAAGSPWGANLLTALAFAAAHVALRPGPSAALTFVPALGCGVLYERSRRILPCVALHSIFNAVWLLGASGSVRLS